MNLKQALVVLLAILLMGVIATVLYNYFVWFVAAAISSTINLVIMFKAINIMVDYDD